MPLFNISYSRLFRSLLPFALRKTYVYAWCSSFATAVTWVYNKFMAGRTANIYELHHTAQRCSLEGVLNDRFDNVLRRIKIVDPDYIDPLYIYRRAENKKRYIYRRSEPQHTYIYRSSETTADGLRFIVQVPLSIPFSEVLMRALIDSYRAASKTNYKIVAI